MNQTLTKILKFPGLHKGHEDEEEKAEMSVLTNVMKNKISKNPTQTMKSTYQQVLEEFPNLPAPSFSSVKSGLYRARAKELPPLPKSPGNIKIRAQWALANNGKRFFFVKCFDFGVCLFAIDKMIGTLAQCEKVLCDGTFKTASQTFLQLFTICGFRASRPKNSSYVPLHGWKKSSTIPKSFPNPEAKIQKVSGEVPNWSPDYLISNFGIYINLQSKVNINL